MPVAYRTETADNDLRNIAYQIGIESGRSSTAEKVVDELIDCCDQLAELSLVSQIGTAASELGRGIRLFSLGNYFPIRRRWSAHSTHRRWQPRLPSFEVWLSL